MEEIMKRRISALVGILFCAVAFPLTVWADSKTYTPPAEKGEIWIVVRHKKSFPPGKTNVSVRWGSWSKSGRFDASAGRYSYEGIVIRLNHKKNDSVPLTVSTDGSIVNVYQGGEPSQKGNSVWQYQEW
jgi:hypothetical protein